MNLAICNEYEDAINRLKAAFKAKKVEYKELSPQVEQHAEPQRLRPVTTSTSASKPKTSMTKPLTLRMNQIERATSL